MGFLWRIYIFFICLPLLANIFTIFFQKSTECLLFLLLWRDLGRIVDGHVFFGGIFVIASFFAGLKREFSGYNAARLMKDILAGLTVCAVALPLALAFGVSSGASAACPPRRPSPARA